MFSSGNKYWYSNKYQKFKKIFDIFEKPWKYNFYISNADDGLIYILNI